MGVMGSLIGLVIAWIYLPWFGMGKTLSSGDWPYLFRETIVSLPAVPGNQALWLDTYYHLTAKLGVQVLGLPWEVTEKLFWFYPFLLIAIASSFIFVHDALPDVAPPLIHKALALVGSLIYTANSYILMIAGGGQMGVAMAYALAPAVCCIFLRLFKQPTVGLVKFVVFSLIVSAQLMFDPRVFIVTVGGALILLLIRLSASRTIGSRTDWMRVAVLLGVAIGINAFWMVPNVLSYRSFYGAATQGDAIGFFSFATFSNAISLLHPNWPQNIFGKIGFMRPEFLFIPMIAFASLLIIGKMKKSLFGFAVLALVGAFLSKGVNDPFGEVYRFLAKIPGFMIFRDPTKFYVLIALSYAVLIPSTLLALTQKMHRRYWAAPLFAFLLLWIVMHRQAFAGVLTGTFQPRTVPPEYVRLKDYFLHVGDDFAVLWVPRIQRFGFYSDTVLPLNSQDELADLPAGDLAATLATAAGEFIRREHVAFVVIPYDSEGEIFLTDRAYDHTKRLAWEKAVDGIGWLEKLVIPGMTERITVYKIRQ